MSKKHKRDEGDLFIEPFGSLGLIGDSAELRAIEAQRVECLGITFENDAARREYFLEKLREHLKDPEFRKIEGFPIGEDEDILRLSDPPYYTACPNPFLGDFIKYYGKPYDPGVPYSKEPFAADVSEGKNDPIYNAHSYHTKVPHKAIMRYILHYTDPGDVVIDFFCGTGMTGVAAQECKRVGSAAYPELSSGSTSSPSGFRHSILCDLSPIATYIAQSLVKDTDLANFRFRAEKHLEESFRHFRWMYETDHVGWPMLHGGQNTWKNREKPHSDTRGIVNFYVWSEQFICPNCINEFVLSQVVDLKTATALDDFSCPHCSVSLTKRQLARAMETVLDPYLGIAISRVKRSLILINYTWNGQRFEKYPDEKDRHILNQIRALPVPQYIPISELLHGERRMKDAFDNIGITYVHHFYFMRTLHALNDLSQRLLSTQSNYTPLLLLLFTSQLVNISVMNRFRRVSFPYNPMSGTFYVGSLVSEANPYHAYENKIKKLERAKKNRASLSSIVSTQSATRLGNIPNNSIDYIFVDPPFGRNLHYSELNSVWEAWLRVRTNRNPEAVMDRGRNREIFEYQGLMRQCFLEGYRVLKPGRWMTVEFHNSKNAVWNAIQEAILAAGFIVADVRTLDKQGETYKQSQQGLVKADLIISAYKPNDGLEDRFKLEAGTEDGVWDFVRTHLKQIPRFDAKNGQAVVIAERQNYLLFDRMVAFHVQRGVTVPLSASEFYAGLQQRFAERDGMFFLSEQVAEYDKKRMTFKELGQLELIPRDEDTAIKWLRQQLHSKPQTFQELQPNFMKSVAGWAKHEKALELSEMLEQNFLRYDGQGDVPSQIHSYLSTNFKELRKLPKDSPALRAKAKDRWYVPDPNKAGDIEKLRERALLKEFTEYRDAGQKKLKVFRLEAVRAGFRKAWQDRDYATIIAVANKIPEEVLQEDSKLLMWYDQALTRTGGAL